MKWPLPMALAGLAPLRIPLRLRALFRAAFALLALAVAALALTVLRDEKQRSHRAYADSLARNLAQIGARLKHPSGQLALLNARWGDAQPARPLVLPWSAIDLDDRHKAALAAETAGCGWRYPDGATLCLALPSQARAGAFVYVVGRFAMGPLVAHNAGQLEVEGASRLHFALDAGGRSEQTLALYQLARDGRGRLAGFDGSLPITHGTRALRDFRGWLWQDEPCIDARADAASCARPTWLAARVPIESLRGAATWPPGELDSLALVVQAIEPGGRLAFDSAAPGARLSFALNDLRELLRPGERLTVRAEGATRDLVAIEGAGAEAAGVAPWIDHLIRRLPVEGFDTPLVVRESLAAPGARWEIALAGDLRGVNAALAAVTTRLLGYAAAILAAIALTWLALEWAIIRRITLLTRRAAAVSSGMRATAALDELDLSDLRGRDELGVLAQGLKDLLARVHQDLARERIRTAQEREQWHAVAHEIVAPLQSLKALHGAPGDASARYVERMLAAVRVLYGAAPPGEAFAARAVALEPLDLEAFVAQVCANAPFVGIDDVHWRGHGRPVAVRADEHALEDAIGHVLRNAARHRRALTPIEIALDVADGHAIVSIANRGAPIDAALVERIFEYGVSGPAAADASQEGRRGQGLFVARTYLAKMGGTIAARNEADGVVFELRLPLGA